MINTIFQLEILQGNIERPFHISRIVPSLRPAISVSGALSSPRSHVSIVLFWTHSFDVMKSSSRGTPLSLIASPISFSFWYALAPSICR